MINCYIACICRARSEGKDDGAYFGSTAALDFYREEAERLGLISGQTLTEAGQLVGDACRNIGEGRAYYYAREYELAALDAFAKPESN